VVTSVGDIKAAPDGFNFVTSKQVDLNIRLLTNANMPIKGVRVNILKPGTTQADGVLFKAISDANGYVKGSMAVPSYLDTVVIQPNYPGLINNAKALITSSVLIATIGGSEGFGGSVVPEPFPVPSTEADPRVLAVDPVSGINIIYPDNKNPNSVIRPNSGGVPKYLESTRDNIDADALSYMNYAFPEGAVNNVSAIHPEYFTSTVTSVNITRQTSLYLTFVSEGASYTNTLGYYTYNTSNPPGSLSDIDNITIVFPNASAAGSGGGLVTGDKVKIGPFNAGTTVGFVILQDAWTGSGVRVTSQKFFSTPALNPESNSSYRRHNFMLNAVDLGVYLFGFEDLNRQSASSNPDDVVTDNDFNDILFYIVPDAEGSIDGTGVSVLSFDPDTDGDGVTDTNDEFPDDAARAYTETTAWKTLAFEDLWPATGDYDMNDLLIQYRYNYVKNAGNEIVEFTGDYKVLAAGAVYNNGFGVEFPFEPSLVKRVTGYKHIRNYITLASNGLEAGQAKAVIIPFDDQHAVINNTGISSPIINTNPNLPKVDGETLHVKVEFNNPVSAATLNTAGFNPFVIESLKRGYEIHLSGKTPTSKGDPAFLGTENDRSNPATGKYYQTSNNWPWAIDIAGTFVQPIEGAAISSAYLHFLDWAQSGGTSYTDWYSNTGTGYRKLDLIYTK
jgi:LruC domain-containing protein